MITACRVPHAEGRVEHLVEVREEGAVVVVFQPALSDDAERRHPDLGGETGGRLGHVPGAEAVVQDHGRCAQGRSRRIQPRGARRRGVQRLQQPVPQGVRPVEQHLALVPDRLTYGQVSH